MRFACDNCHAQYMINDEKVGPSGVVVRCKKCQHKIIVKRAPATVEEDRAEATIVMSNPMAAEGFPPAPSSETTSPGDAPLPAEADLEEDIGRAFDSVLSEPQGSSELTAPGTDPIAQPEAGSFPFSTPAGEESASDTDRQSTRVVNLAEMASLMRPEGPKKDEPSGDSSGSASEPKPAESKEPPIEWFVAINDQQVGPLDFEGIKGHWEKGELSADSLVWHGGMADWRPLSSVPELADKLAPVARPKAAEQAPADAKAAGAPASSDALPPPQAEPEAPAWKPSAASALDSLVRDELDVLSSPPKRQEPARAEARSASGGLFDDLPEAPEPAPAPAPAPAPIARQTPAPAPMAAEPPVAPEAPVTEPQHELPRPSRQSHQGPRPGSRQPAPRAQAYAAPAPQKKMGLFVALGIGGGLLGVGAIAVVLLLVFKQPTVVAPPAPSDSMQAVAQPQPPQPQPIANANPQPQQPAVAPAADAGVAPGTEAAAEQARPAAENQPEEKVAQADSVKEPEKPVEKPAEKAVERPAADSSAKRAERQAAKAQEAERRERARAQAQAQAQAQREQPEPEEEAIRPQPKKPEPEPEQEVASRSKIDNDFDKLFGGSSGASEPEPKQEKNKPKTVYIPPPAGGGGKETLTQGDIMEVVLRHKGDIKRCTDEQKAREPDSSGTITMRWSIRKDGKTTGIQALTQEYRKSPLSACLGGVIKGFQFPAYTGAQMQPIDFPFKF